MLTIELTKDEQEVLEKYLLHKLDKLELSGLTDSKCYSLLYSIYNKIRKDH